MGSSELNETTMNEKTRTLTQITLDDARREDCEKWLNILIGDDIDGRKGYYRNYLGL